jgi:hypothetical protein
MTDIAVSPNLNRLRYSQAQVKRIAVNVIRTDADPGETQLFLVILKASFADLLPDHSTAAWR